MYKPFEQFNPPSNLDQKIWRYMDTSKFLDLIFTSGLFFPHISKLGDKHEGTLTKKMFDNMEQFDASIDKENEDLYREKELGEVPRRNQVRGLFEMLRKNIYVNCWHMNEFESAAMWRLYSRLNEGIAIQSSFSMWCDSFAATPVDIHIGVVEHMDFDRELYNKNFLGELHKPFVLKRKSFEHEREIRALILDHGRKSELSGDLKNGGFKIKVNLNKLVQKVYVAPESPEWYKDDVQIILDRANINIKVVKSDLDKDPVL